MVLLSLLSVFFFFNDTATTEIYTLSLHDALPIFRSQPALIQLHNRQPRASFIPGLPTHIRLALHQHLGQSVAFNYLDGLGWLPSRKVEIIHRSEEHTSELQSRLHLVCRLLLEKKKALVLFAVATAQVKGFALMLLIGTVLSLITAVVATRAMLGLLAGFSWFNKPRFMGAQRQQGWKWLQIDYMGKRYLWFAISGLVIVLGIAALGVRGLNLGIDFKGGTQLSFKTPVAHT